LLYLPEPYVVPGGRFNEMYGWDSYFIVLGLVKDGQQQLARQQTENFLYEVERYGKVLNANRTYYLTRSQPPLLSRMVFRAHPDDAAWMTRARRALEATHRYWTSPPHLAGDTGLSRYFDSGTGPAPEVVNGERDAAGLSHYDRVRAFYRTHPVDAYDVNLYYDRPHDRLTDLFYVGDRSMRESGFDPSDRFGPFGVDVIHYAPVCLNVLLAMLETDLSRLAEDRETGERWRAMAQERRRRIDRYLWDESSGLYLDWNFQSGKRRHYPFATTFWPLWAGLASRDQAARVKKNLPLFERPGGLRTSDRATGNQWDAPFGWAPLQLFAVGGLRRYDYGEDADRIARAFLSMVVEDFERRGAIVEKYDVERRTSQVEGGIRFGYAENQVGFGWTNGVFLELLAGLGSKPELL
jgi:alpha,alpha-trehalase